MNKQDTAENRALISNAIADRLVSQPGSTSDEIRWAVLAVIDARFPGCKHMIKRDELVTLFDTMEYEEFERLEKIDAERNKPGLCELL